MKTTCSPSSGDWKSSYLNRKGNLNICKDKTPVKWKGTLYVFCLNACIVSDIEGKIQGRKRSIYWAPRHVPDTQHFHIQYGLNSYNNPLQQLLWSIKKLPVTSIPEPPLCPLPVTLPSYCFYSELTPLHMLPYTTSLWHYLCIFFCINLLCAPSP